MMSSSSTVMRQSPRLANLALKVTINSILDFFLSPRFKIVEDFKKFRLKFQKSLSAPLKEHITMEVMPILIKKRREHFPEILRFFLADVTQTRILEVFLNHRNFGQILDVIAPHIKELHYLKMICSNLSTDKIYILFSLKYKNLQSLHLMIDWAFDFKILGLILRNCPLLKELTIVNIGRSSQFLYSEHDAGHVKMHQNLRTFEYVDRSRHLQMPDVLKLLVKKLPMLEFVNLPDYLVSSIGPLLFLKLTEVALHNTSLEEIKVLIASCRDLISLELFIPQRGVIRYLSKSKRIRKLILYQFKADELNGFVEISGSQIVSLTLEFGDVIDLNYILNSCSNLVHFYVLHCDKVLAEQEVIFYDAIREFSFLGFSQVNLRYLIQGFRNIEYLQLDPFQSFPFANLNTDLIPSWQNLKKLSLDFVELFKNKELLSSLVQSCPKLEILQSTLDFDDNAELNEAREFLKQPHCKVRLVCY